MKTKLNYRVHTMESDIASLRADQLMQRDVSTATLAVLGDLRTLTEQLHTTTEELRRGQEELRNGQSELRTTVEELRTTTDELRRGQDELRAEMRAGHSELREEIITVKRSVGNLELSMKRVEGDVAELKAGHLELRNLVSGMIR
ncbi:hypothetical protein HS041_22225 [Planomonospora sp. ID67723]|uniref:hypothetical protein n=1 Tax=Planomonospora sp. ID67723 TaxID=2738134 RepID=UPI0018C38846|nr:hypothetical protein [Planomonospora sp. ID67723]MBG0830481.1 hypothetical protein [Planomonospora sp. ID67723]